MADVADLGVVLITTASIVWIQDKQPTPIYYLFKGAKPTWTDVFGICEKALVQCSYPLSSPVVYLELP